LAPYQLVTVTITATTEGGTSGNSNKVTGRTLEAGIDLILSIAHHHLMYVLNNGNQSKKILSIQNHPRV